MMVRPTTTFGELVALRRAVEHLFDDPSIRPAAAQRAPRRLALDVIETGDALVLEAALPGVRPEDVDVSLLGDVLTVSAGSDTDDTSEHEGVRVREIRRGRVSRSVTLPQGVDADRASATFENGLLRLAIPKSQPLERMRIPVTVPVQGQVEASASQAVDAAGETVAVTPETPATDVPGV